MTEPTDAELGQLAEECGIGWASGLGGMDDFLRTFARAVLAKWGTPPAVAGDTIIEAPSSYQWITEPSSVEHFGIPGQVRKVVANVATPQPTQAQAGAVPLTKEQRSRIVLTADTVSEAIGMVERHHGIKGGQHGADT